MTIRSLSGLLAVVVTTACASLHQVSIPDWERYQEGELAGFLRAPVEHVVKVTSLGWRSAIRTVHVSDAADAAAQVTGW